MNRITVVGFFVFCIGSLTGCVTPQSFVDPQYHKATYEAIQRLAQPIPVKVDVQFQRNGTPLPGADNELRGHVERTLRATGVFSPATADTQATVKVTGNNIADLAVARSKGIKTGITFGAAGSIVDDNYEFVCVYQGGGDEKKFSYPHALHSIIGHAQAPAGMTLTTPADAFGRVVEDVILNCVKDLQDSGAVPKP